MDSKELIAWEPAADVCQQARELAGLGWPAEEIAESLALTPAEFASMVTQSAELAQALQEGAESFKSYPIKAMNWRPKPADLREVRRMAATGLTPNAIASRMRINRGCFHTRLADTPQLMDAFNAGNGDYQANRIDEWNRLIDDQTPALKYVGGPFMFTLKAYCGLSDKPEQVKAEPLQVTVQHTHELKTPQPVALTNLPEYARIEMERAKRISDERMRLAVPEPEPVDAEVTSG